MFEGSRVADFFGSSYYKFTLLIVFTLHFASSLSLFFLLESFSCFFFFCFPLPFLFLFNRTGWSCTDSWLLEGKRKRKASERANVDVADIRTPATLRLRPMPTTTTQKKRQITHTKKKNNKWKEGATSSHSRLSFSCSHLVFAAYLPAFFFCASFFFREKNDQSSLHCVIFFFY